MNNKYYVYVHYTKDTGLPFYVGKGCGSRAWTSSHRNPYWHNTANKYGVDCKILWLNLCEKDALLYEANAILELKSFGFKLTNLSGGGEAPKMCSETKLKIALAHKGKKFSLKHKENLAKAHKGKKHTVTTRLKISKGNLGKTVTEKQRLNLSLCKQGVLNPGADTTVYWFKRLKDGLIIKATRMQLCEKFELNRDRVGKLFKKYPAAYAVGWKLAEEQND